MTTFVRHIKAATVSQKVCPVNGEHLVDETCKLIEHLPCFAKWVEALYAKLYECDTVHLSGRKPHHSI